MPVDAKGLTSADEVFGKCKATVIDVRPTEEYAWHIPGAVSIPLERLAERLAELPLDQEVVAYCRGAYCVLVHDAVRLRTAQGRPARRRPLVYEPVSLPYTVIGLAARRERTAMSARGRAVDHLTITCRCLIGVVFLVSAVSKTGRPFGDFVGSLRALRILPPASAGAVALVIVTCEFAIAAAMAWTVTVRPGAVAAIGLLAVFTAGIALIRARGAVAPCRCFGPGGAPLGARHIARNVVLLLAACVPAVSGVGLPADVRGLALAVAIGVLGALVIARLDLVVDLFRKSALVD